MQVTVKRQAQSTMYSRRNSGRIYVSDHRTDGADTIAEPTDPCVDPSCESWTCRNGHAAHLIAFLMPQLSSADIRQAAGYTYIDGNLPQPEADHKQYKAYGRRYVAKKREAIDEAIRLGLLPALKPSFSRKAGCGCGCSPGWRVNDHWLGEDIFIDVFDDEQQLLTYQAERAAAPADAKRKRLEKELAEAEALKQARIEELGRLLAEQMPDPQDSDDCGMVLA